MDTQTTILETARRLFHQQGYVATGIAQILKGAGVNSGSLYHFFSSKQALLVGVLERYAQDLEPVIIEPAEAVTADPIERIFALLAGYRRALESSGCKIGCPIGNLALEVGDAPQVRPLIEAYFSTWTDRVERWLLAAGDRLPADTHRRDVAQLVLTATEGAIMQARAAASIAPFDACVAQLRMYFDLLEERA